MSDRVRRLAELARAGSYELVQMDGRDALRICSGGGTSTSFLTPAELVELRRLLADGPPAFNVPGVGRFAWERHLFQRREGDVTMLLVDVHEPPVDATALGRAFVRARDAAPQICRAAARQLGRLYNDTWRDGPQLSADEMAARMRLAAITLYAPDGVVAKLVVSFDDGNLFGGHTIEVPVELDDAMTIGRPDIVG